MYRSRLSNQLWYKFLQVDISVDYLENLGSTSTLKPQVYTLLVTSKLVGIRKNFRILILVRNSSLATKAI